MSTAKLRTFKADGGDCIFFLLRNDEGEEYHMMIDCGKYSSEVSDFVRNEFNSHIDLLVVTHIDKDHINGVATMLEKEVDLSVGKILFNCHQRRSINVQPVEPALQDKIDTLANNLTPVVVEENYHVSARKAISLAQTICGNANYLNAWHKEYITDETDNLTLRNSNNREFGELVFLSPKASFLDSLDDEFKKAFLLHFFKSKDVEYNEDASIFELLSLISDQEYSDQADNEKISSSDYTREGVEKLAKLEEPEDTKPSNKASLAFMWICGDSRVLFLGDSNPHCVSENIKRKFAQEDIPLSLNAVKVSHHGSVHNTTNELLDCIKTGCYVFTGGDCTHRPHESTIAKIILKAVIEDTDCSLHFNCQNTTTDAFVHMIAEQKRDLHFNATYEQPDEFRY